MEAKEGKSVKMKVTVADNLMEPVKGTMREGLHVALDDLMDDIEKRDEASSGGMAELHADVPPYRHVLRLTVTIETQLLIDPRVN